MSAPAANRQERALGPIHAGLRKDLHFTRQETRSGPRYLVHDPITFANHALSPLDYRIVTAITPRRSLGEVFTLLVERGVLDDDDKQGFFDFVLWLHAAGLLQLPISSGDRLFQRHVRKQAARRAGGWTRVFLSCKIPLLDPDRLLQRTLPYVGWLFSRVGLLLWLALMASVWWVCGERVTEFLDQSAGLLAWANLPILWVALVLLKALHEFGHAYACRRFGGPVPEMGVVFIFMTPCAYVDASSSWKFTRRRHRVAVTVAGMYVESIAAGIFALVWAGTQPGLLHDIALNVVVLAGVVTVLMNLNPLMKFDGYYLFSDLAGVFNLQERAARLAKEWIGHLLLGQPRPCADYSRGETWLYALYGPSAFAYRVALAFAITGLVMMQWPGAGLFLGGVFAWSLIVRPVVGMFVWLWCADETRPVRSRARAVAAGLVVATPFAFGFVPVSMTIVAPGILDPRERTSVRAPAGGFVREVAVDNGTPVRPGDLLCVLTNPELEMRRLRMVGEAEAEQTALDAVELEDSTRAATHRSRLAYLRAGVEELDERLASMSITASAAGTVVSPDLPSCEGAFLQHGTELFQIQSGHRYLRIVLTEHEVARARLEVGSVAEVRWTCQPDRATRAVVREIRRSASRADVPLALTMLAGGDVYALPDASGDRGRVEADRPYLHVFLRTDHVPLPGRGDGLTARVRFPARVETLGGWLQRRLQSFWNSWRMS